jgi:hypothetical protein
MKLQLRHRFALAVAFSAAVLAGTVQAQDSATLYLAHAASGRDMSSTTDPALPIDVSINGVCVVKGESFGEILGPYSFPAGTLLVRVSMANSLAPCSNAVVYSASAALAAGDSLGVLSVVNSSITGRIYPIGLSSLPAGVTRAYVTNATTQTIAAIVTDKPETNGSGGQFIVPAEAIEMATPPTGLNYVSLYLAGTNPLTLEAGPYLIETEPRNVYLYVIAGSAANHSVQLIGPRVILNVL